MSLRLADRLQGLQPTLLRKVMESATPDCLNLGLGQTGDPVPPALLARVAQAPTEAGYIPNAGLPALRDQIAAEAQVDVSRVVVTCGVQEALALTLFAMVNPGDEVLVPDPGFPVYATLTRLAGGVPVPVPLRHEAAFRPTWRDIKARLTSRTRLVVLASPGNPTGAVARPEDWKEIGEETRARGLAVLSDEIYLDLPQGDRPHKSVLAYNQETAFVAAGLSKRDSLAGWRLGWLIAPEEAVTPLIALHQHWVTSASSLVQHAALAAFTPEAADARRALGERLVRQRATARARLEAMGFEVAAGDGAFYLWVRHPDWPDDWALVQRLLTRAKVITMPGRAFGDGGMGYLRISYALHEPHLSRALDRMEMELRASG